MEHLNFRFRSLILSLLTAGASLHPPAAFADDPANGTPTMTVVQPKPASEGLLRNPASGWVLYMETLGTDTFETAGNYWKQADPFVSSASIFYIRCTWTQMEPQEGHYAWKEDANFQALIEGARQRHLKLAFRVVTNSRDCRQQATPGWVQAAGAAGYTETGQGRELWTPSVKDLVFRRKLENFVTAFAKEFDDPSRVDYIDGCGLGWWGEMHHLDSKSKDNPEVLDWICRTYGNAFHHVLLGIQVNSPLGEWGKLDNIPIDRYGYVARMDSLGSSWLSPGGRKILSDLFPKTPFFAESCYFSLESMPNWKKDVRKLKTIRDVLQATYDDATNFHANTLDLREPRDATVWTREAGDLVASFIAKGGYRLYPASVGFPSKFTADQAITITHTWQNLGAGVMANDNPRWKQKYRVAFSLLDPASKKVVAMAVDGQADPGTWTAGPGNSNVFSAAFAPAPAAGRYLLAAAIVNTQNGNQPEIKLAVVDLTEIDGWSVLGEVQVEMPAPATGNDP